MTRPQALGRVQGLLFAVFALLGAGAACLAPGCGGQKPAVVRLAVNPGIYSGLIALARDQGFFRDAGLDVRLQELASGNQCFGSLAKGQAQLATMSEYVLARRAAQAPGLRIAAAIATADINEVVARTDRNIATPSELKGKRVGLPAKTAALYYFEAFLLLHGMDAAELTLVDIPPQDVAQALKQGRVDAITGWDALVWEARKQLAGKVVSWLAPRQDFHWLLVARGGDGGLPPEVLQRFLGALLQAQNLCRTDPAKAKAIIARTWQLEPEFVDHYWERLRLGVTLDNTLPEALGLAAKWLKQSGSLPGDIPDYRRMIFSEPLRALDNSAVRMLGGKHQ